MSAKPARRGEHPRTAASRHGHPTKHGQEQLQRENDRLRQENEQLRRKVFELGRKVAERDQQIADAEKQIADAEKQLADAEKQIADLERQLALCQRNSTNSSKPPSSDGLAGEQRPRGRKDKSKRKPGGQPGHAGHHRPLAPLDKVSVIEVVLPKQCGHCGRNLPQQPDQGTTTAEPRQPQGTEVPPVKAHITEYQLTYVGCDQYG